MGLLLPAPYYLTGNCLLWVAHRWPDPRLPEAARAVRRAAWACLFLTMLLGLAFSGWCYYKSVTYQRGPWLDFGAELWGLSCFLPLLALIQVVVAVLTPVRVSLAPTADDFGFRRH
ncbi:MAG: hypothetical protein KF760_00010 [Candidatus Eremiobacteraeota bacterium]|nr:hypothetical protein [Candidatus Eremiobacteraeota bacterium]